VKEMSLAQRVNGMQQTVKMALEQSQRLEAKLEAEMKRAKSERIQNTLTALCNHNGKATVIALSGKDGREKRPYSLVDMDNVAGSDDVIKSKTVFECSAEVGLRLAKRPKNESVEIRALRDAVEADCASAKARHPSLALQVTEEYGLPLVTCQLMIPEIKLPKLFLRVQRGYPRKGGATYGFERPALGWVGVLADIHLRFKNAISISPGSSVGLASYLEAWASEATVVMDAERKAGQLDAGTAMEAEHEEPQNQDVVEELTGSSFDLPADFAALASASVVV
jgi:hypothetical protein